MFGVQRIGRYEVLNHLASGGMGQVYLARSTGLGGFERQVVVKTLDLSVTDDDAAFVTMFLDEARLVGALNHQYIAPVYEVGCDEEGNYYLVMDYVHGETAEAVFRVSGERSVRLPLGFSLTVVTAVASALDYAHSLCAADGTPLDIVHRDVSLSNIMCGHDGGVKLIDFGIAKAANRATKTQTGTLKGKIGYLAPEQIHRQNVDHRADIFALGIVLYEMTTGVRAFREASDLVTLEKITKGEVRRPSEVATDYPAELERIVMKALEVDPDKRYQSAEGMAHSLEKLAAKMQLPLGHGAITDVMGKLFSDHKGRRRIARGSNEVKTDSAQTLLPDARPVTEPVDELRPPTLDERVVARLQGVAARAQRPTINELSRAQRPTMPIKEGARSQRATVPLEDRPTPIAEPAAQMRAQHALIPLEDRPTPIAEPLRGGVVTSEASPADSAAATITTTSTAELLAGLASDTVLEPSRELAALPQTPVPSPAAPSGRPRIGTGPQLPMDIAEPELVDDAPTVLSASPPDRDDPTDAKTNLVHGEQPQQFYVVQKGSGTSVVERLRLLEVEATTRTWIVMAAMFVVALIVATIIALV